MPLWLHSLVCWVRQVHAIHWMKPPPVGKPPLARLGPSPEGCQRVHNHPAAPCTDPHDGLYERRDRLKAAGQGLAERQLASRMPALIVPSLTCYSFQI